MNIKGVKLLEEQLLKTHTSASSTTSQSIQLQSLDFQEVRKVKF